MKTWVDDLIEAFDMECRTKDGSKSDSVPVTIWIPKDKKAKYDLLQESYKKKFVKLAKEVLNRTIDIAYEKLSASKPAA